MVKELNLRGNLISDPTNFFMMLSLEVLDLGANRINTFTADMIIDNLKLRELNLTENQISEIERYVLVRRDHW